MRPNDSVQPTLSMADAPGPKRSHDCHRIVAKGAAAAARRGYLLGTSSFWCRARNFARRPA